MNNQTSTRRQTLSVIVCVSIGLTIALLLFMAVFTSQDRAKDDAEQEVKQTENAAAAPPSEPNDSSDNADEDAMNGIGEDNAAELFEPVTGEIGDAEADAVPDGSEKSEEVIAETTESEKPTAPKPTVPTFAAPVSGAVSKTHDEDLPVYSVTMNDYRVHLGVDVACAVGAPVTACADGVVKSVSEELFMGHTVAIDHGNGYVTYCKNLADIFPDGITEGAKVEAGQIIGAVGESALCEIADQPHLHFEMTHDGVSVDPLDYVEFDGAVDYSE